MYKYLIILAVSLFSLSAIAQKKILQFSGIVVTEDSLQAVPYTSIYVVNKGLGTTTDFYGYFSFVASAGDTVQFSAVGYKRNIFVVPKDFIEEKYTLIHVLHSDTVMLNETVVYPWPSKEQFKQAFLTLNIPDDDVERARKNLSQEELAKRAEELPVSGSLAFKYQMQQRNDRLYYAGQAPPIQILNPFAWAKFIESWRNGDFKRKKN
jgi:signal peptidase I